MIYHGVDGVLQLQKLAFHIHHDFLRQVTPRYSRGHLGNVSHLLGEVLGHHINVIRQVFPDAGHAVDLGLAAERSFRTQLAGHARDFRRQRGQVVGHRVDVVLQLQKLTLDIDRDLL